MIGESGSRGEPALRRDCPSVSKAGWFCLKVQSLLRMRAARRKGRAADMDGQPVFQALWAEDIPMNVSATGTWEMLEDPNDEDVFDESLRLQQEATGRRRHL